MDSDPGPDVVVRFQKQTTTSNLSDYDFASKAAAASARIKVSLPALSEKKIRTNKAKKAAIPGSGTPSSQRTKLATITEDEPGEPRSPVPRSKELNCTSHISQSKLTEANMHPGEHVPIVYKTSFVSLDPSDTASYTGSDNTTKPNYDNDASATDPRLSLSNPWRFSKYANGSYKEVNMAEVAPWLYQDDEDAEFLVLARRSTDETPPSTLGRVSTAYKSLSPEVAQMLRLSLSDESNGTSSSSTTVTSNTGTPGSRRKSSFKEFLTPSPALRRISSKVSLTSLRVPSFKPDNSFQSDSFSPLNRNFHSPHAEVTDSHNFDSTIGVPYEDNPCGPAPLTEDIDSVRARRGFRPLSVITGAVNYSIDPFRTMAEAEMQIVDEENKVSAKYPDALRNCSSDTILLAPKESSRETDEAHNSSDRAVSSSSSEQIPPTIYSDASTLFNTPPPLLTDHPLNREGQDPFEIRTNYPLMITSTPARLIKALAHDMQQLSSKSAGFVDDLRKKKSYRNLGGSLPRSAPPIRLISSHEFSPPSASTTTLAIRTSDDSVATTSSSSRTPICNSNSSQAKPLRKISTFFRRDMGESGSIADSHASVQTPTSSIGKNSGNKISLTEMHNLGTGIAESSKGKKKKDVSEILPHLTGEDESRYLECWLRNHLAYHRKRYNPGKWPHYPPHPNHKMAWDHKNLRCKTCVDSYCGCCGRTCCAYRALVVRLSLLPEDSIQARQETLELKQAIEIIFFVGCEEPTFLQCTDCKKMTCPNCCGICPIDGCHDTECRKCKSGDPWNPCSLHENVGTPDSNVGSKFIGRTEGIGDTPPMSPEASALRKQWVDELEEKYLREEMKGGLPAFWHPK